ncbi:Lrp/AsnC family transcriptional regulator [Pseudoalteromonas denitrificans]|jgi:DNA-binding Lrp family transcriptional regulator|uniref:siroheme decarboxylase n=1 Tax=Pseudoalteromonas denitrificans DSM 6059 TaxID=1123010 RepID=A0A1I1MTE3_9GAMM|nr:Lrp/AsnC family transcriptional regulator [Pseudoalteromonas denitrificans]SFC88172.1 DNA-binding transcriptional regulator, Lrp family [Pseudoalteromonas denitrificans DSM 6059]
MDNLDKQLINLLQKGLPVCEKPFLAIAIALKTTEEIVLNKLQDMLDSGLLTRFGPMFDAACLGGAFTLAAMQVPQAQFDDIAKIVNSFEQVAHNYERENQLNMWFVIGTETQNEILEVIEQIEKKTGISVVNMPKEHEFFVGLYLPV